MFNTEVVSFDVLRQPREERQAFSLPMMAVKSSGDDEPPAMKVAPATSSSSPNLYEQRKRARREEDRVHAVESKLTAQSLSRAAMK